MSNQVVHIELKEDTPSIRQFTRKPTPTDRRIAIRQATWDAAVEYLGPVRARRAMLRLKRIRPDLFAGVVVPRVQTAPADSEDQSATIPLTVEFFWPLLCMWLKGAAKSVAKENGWEVTGTIDTQWGESDGGYNLGAMIPRASDIHEIPGWTFTNTGRSANRPLIHAEVTWEMWGYKEYKRNQFGRRTYGYVWPEVAWEAAQKLDRDYKAFIADRNRQRAQSSSEAAVALAA